MADQTELLSSWSTYVERLQQDVSAFYSAIEAAVKEREIPDAKFKRINLKEGGMLSASREYLRITRGDLRFEVCGAPFGNGFFVSYRLFAEGKLADHLVGEMSKGGMLSQVTGALVAKAVGVDTYYKLDTARMFHAVVHQAVIDTVNDVSEAASLPYIPTEERRPILKGFFQ